MRLKCFIGKDKTDCGLESDFYKVLGCKLIKCTDLLVKDLIEIDKESNFITSQLKGLPFVYGSFITNVRLWVRLYIKNYIRHLYGDDTQFHYGIFKNGNGKYILAYYRKHLRDISGMVEFDDAIDFLEKMRAMGIKEPIIRIVAMVSDDGQD